MVTNKKIHFADQVEENPIRLIAVKNTMKFYPGDGVYMMKKGEFVKRRSKYLLGYVLSTNEEDDFTEIEKDNSVGLSEKIKVKRLLKNIKLWKTTQTIKDI
jgi:hypothetical protein